MTRLYDRPKIRQPLFYQGISLYFQRILQVPVKVTLVFTDQIPLLLETLHFLYVVIIRFGSETFLVSGVTSC